MTKVADFRDLGVEELRRREQDLDDQLFRLRIQKSMGQADVINKIRNLRLDLARVKTLMREQQS